MSLSVDSHIGRVQVQPRAFWDLVRRELLTNEGVRTLASERRGAGVPRSTLLRWRQEREFPAPVLAFNLRTPRALELWSRSEVVEWLDRQPGPRP